MMQVHAVWNEPLRIIGIIILLMLLQTTVALRSFVVDYENNVFLKDGEPFVYMSGSVHYMRILPEYWTDRLRKLRAAGFNAVQTYIEWSSHEPEPYQYNFSSINDFEAFVKKAQEEDLLVILRIGPYICAERDLGGFPYWILKNRNVTLRSDNGEYLSLVNRWFDILLPKIVPLLYRNGGPVIMIQLENEYGSIGCNSNYTLSLKQIVQKHLQDMVVYFTTDGNEEIFLRCGNINGTLSTIDFGPYVNITQAFAMLRRVQPKGPLVNSEYYSGWLDYWGYPHQKRRIDDFIDVFESMIKMNASVNVYMFHGGTSFGLKSGCSLSPLFRCTPTSYDYDALLDESGNTTDKYFATRQLLLKYFPDSGIPVPVPKPAFAYGDVFMHSFKSLKDLISSENCIRSDFPLTFEELELDQGYVFYETVVQALVTDPALLYLPGIRDRGYVYVNNDFVSVVAREQSIFVLPILVKPGDTLGILVESEGRIFYGFDIFDRKGIIMNVSLNDVELANWTQCVLSSNSINQLLMVAEEENMHRKAFTNISENKNSFKKMPFPTIYIGSFVLNHKDRLEDTYMRLDQWRKGIVFMNHFVLGRYWTVMGPQKTLYVPKHLLRPFPKLNVVYVLEMERLDCSHQYYDLCYVSFVDVPDIDSITPNRRSVHNNTNFNFK